MGDEMHLTPREREVAELLLAADPAGLQAGEIAAAVYGIDDRAERHAVRLLVVRLRKKGLPIVRWRPRAPYRLRQERSA